MFYVNLAKHLVGGLKMSKVRFGIVGCGGMGSGHCSWMNTIMEAELTAVCDIRKDIADQTGARYNVPAFYNAVDMLDSGLVDAIIIATPHYFHPPIAIEAFKRKVHVISEKPLGVNVSAVDEMISAAKSSGVRFAVMYQMRSISTYQMAHKLIEEGRLGEIYRTALVMGWYRSQAYYNSGGWRATWSGEGGGVLINQAPHFLDMFSWLAGLPAKLTASTRTRMHNIEVEDEAFATLEYANGAHGYLYCSTNEAPGCERIEICGDKGKILLENGKLRFWEMKTPIRQHNSEAQEMWSGPEVQEVALDYVHSGGAHADITRNFCQSILFDAPLLSPGEEGLNAVELINGVILSGHTNQSVTFPVDRTAFDALLTELQKTSHEKQDIKEQLATDPHYV
jgi:predicted dehydrogenase